MSEHAMNEAFVQLEKVNATKTKISAKVKIDCNTNKGVIKKSVTVKTGREPTLVYKSLLINTLSKAKM